MTQKSVGFKAEPRMRNYSIKLLVSFFFFLILTEVGMAQNTSIVPVNIGVVLDFDSVIGKMGLSCINVALSDFYASFGDYKTRLVLAIRDSKRDVVGAAAAALELIKNVQVQAIIGPVTSMQANFIIGLGDKAQVPIISFSATSPSLTSLRSSYFFRATQNDYFQVKAISAIVQAIGWREAVPIYADTEYGESIIPYLADALKEIDTSIPYRSVIHPSATNDQIVEELYKLMTMQTRVFIVHMLPLSLCSRLFVKAKEVGMMTKGYAWIVTDGIANLLTSLDPLVIESMQGVLGVNTYVPKTQQIENFRVRWKKKFQQENPTIVDADLNVLGLSAYDSAVALAMAVEKIGTNKFGYQKNTNLSSNSSTTDLETFGVSQIGPELRQALADTQFTGLVGDFHFVNQQLQPLGLKIINVNGIGAREIGFWTPEKGLTRNFNSKNTNTYSTSKSDLGPIIWPGDSTSIPKGWEIPTKGNRLKVGVPVKHGFIEFVNVTTDPMSNRTSVTGFCRDVFDAVMESLPYVVEYDYVPFETPDGKKAGTYDDLVYQVYLGKYDVVVGDVTIIANRSAYVDFTLPFAESDVYMVVPIKDEKRKHAWVFMEPLTWDLWVTSGCFFVFIGFVVWVLEHRINDDFRGPPSHQVGTSFWFAFSTMVFAHRERVVSNLARFVVIVWVFLVLILSSSYTASLTSLLTVQQLQPTVTDVSELLKKGENVGYHDGSFVYGILKSMGFDSSKLKKYGSPEECDEAFSNGTANGGIAAVFDEVPYMELFLARYCSKYTMLQPIFKTAGFGFVFPKGSPLVKDVSKAILEVREGDKMKEIEKEWLGQPSNCPNTSTTVSSESLTLKSFWGLFLLVGLSSTISLIIFAIMFLYQHWHILTCSNPKTSLWTKFLLLCKHFNQKDLTSHTFRKSEMGDRAFINGGHSVTATEVSPNSNYPPSPWSYSTQKDSKFEFCGEQGTPSPEHGDPTNTNGHQAFRQVFSVIELTNPNDQEGARITEIAHESV